MRKALFAAALLGAAGTTSAQLINEFEPNPGGADPADMNFEILGTPGASFSGWVLSLEADNQTSAGTVDRASQVGGVFDANGILNVIIPDFENPSNTVYLTSDFLGSVGTDYDVDDNGALDSLADFGTIYDALGVPDAAGDEFLTTGYATQVGGTGLTAIGFEPSLVFRDGVSGDWYQAGFTDVFDVAGNQLNNGDFTADPTLSTFGAVNPTLIPAPASAALLGLGGLVAARRRR
ncbi:MAG: hypothetical protein ED559_09440 [Phycisphaera sp.]|nr:MAG: hypothetical protein ED559_09440 [Phycisphaera sp.]